jgi:hypothetical protein
MSQGKNNKIKQHKIINVSNFKFTRAYYVAIRTYLKALFTLA